MKLKLIYIFIGISESFRRTAYYTRERSGTPLEQIPSYVIGNLTHLIYSFGYLNTKTNYVQVIHNVLSKDSTILTGDLATLFQLKLKYRHLHTGISISGLFGDVPFTSYGVKGVAKSIVQLVDNFGLDFVDIDWEFPVIGDEVDAKGSVSDPNTFLQLVKVIQIEFQAYQYRTGLKPQLSIALPCPWYYLQYYNMENLHPYLDIIHIMSYDFNTPSGDVIYHQSNLDSSPLIPTTSIKNSTQYLINLGIPSDKLVLGIPAYVYTFKFNNSFNNILGQPFLPQNTTDKLSQTLLSALPPTYQYQHLLWDDVAKASYMIDAKNHQFISLDTIRSVNYKLDYIKHNQLGGIFLWALSWETEGYPLLSTFNNLEPTNQINHIHYKNSKFKNVAVTASANSLSILPHLYLFLSFILINQL